VELETLGGGLRLTDSLSDRQDGKSSDSVEIQRLFDFHRRVSSFLKSFALYYTPWHGFVVQKEGH
jgi:hypothetical protein